MPRDCTNCGPIAKTSLLAGVILFFIGYFGDLYQYGRVFLYTLYYLAPLAWLVGFIAGVRGWIGKRSWSLGIVTLLNGVFLAAMIGLWISQIEWR
jgi:uncharacterized membrane protein